MTDYLGYPALNGLLAAYETDRLAGEPLDCIDAVTTHTTKHGIQMAEVAAHVGFADKHRRANYCHIVLGVYAVMEGRPFGEEDQHRADRALDGYRIVESWLSARYQLANRMVSLPKNLTLIEGRADFLGYDKDRGFYLKGEP